MQSIVGRDFKAFVARLSVLASISIPASVINSMLKYLNSKIGFCFRKRLVKHFHNEYLQGLRYYQVSNIDSRLSNPYVNMHCVLAEQCG